MKKLAYLISVALLILNWSGCSEDELSDYTDPNTPAPAQISNVSVQASPGGGTLTYTLPADESLSYVKAVYEIQPGVFREAKSSRYKNTLELVGFGDTNSHEVKLYSVGKNEKASEPVIVTLAPLTPPVATIFNTVEFSPAFGGINVKFENSNGANMIVQIMVDSSGLGTWAPVATYYTAAKNGNFSVRGYPPTERKFAVYLKDRWNNKSDTLIKTMTPLLEQLIPKSDFREYVLPTDNPPGASWSAVKSLWDEKFVYDAYVSKRTDKFPMWVTIDLGHKVILNRLKVFSSDKDHAYQDGGLKTFEIWGSNNPDPNGGWNNWVLLGRFEAHKPSGLPLGQTTAEDINYATFLGDDHEFTSPGTATRYIRLKALENYGSDGQIVISELTFWGQIQ